MAPEDQTPPSTPSPPAAAPLEEDPPSLAQRFLNLRTALSFALGFGILVFLATRMGVEVDAIWARLSNVHLGYYLLALGLYYLTFPVRGLRWLRLLSRAGFNAADKARLPSVRGASVMILLAWFANCIVPAKLGDAYRAYLLKRRIQVSFSRTVGTILAERIIDTLLLVSLLGGSALLAFRGVLPAEVVGIMQMAVALAVLVALGLLLMRNLSQWITRLVPARFRPAYGRFEEGTLGSFQALPVVVLYSVLAWAIEAGRLYLVSQALGLSQLPIAVIVFVALASALLTSIPVTPAGLGFVETGMIGILLLAAHMNVAPGVDQNVATSLAILDRSISYWSLIGIGLIVYLVGRQPSAVSRQPSAVSHQPSEASHQLSEVGDEASESGRRPDRADG